jgi:hypothetical protein
MTDSVSVKFGADVAGLVAGARQATDAMKGFAHDTRSALSSLTAPFAQLQRMILGVAAVAAGGAVFKSFVDAATTASGEVLRLSKALGINREEANLLRVQLHGAGVGVDDYVTASLQLDRQLRSNETAIRATGMATRDANGQLLDGHKLMTNALATLKQYREGTQQNIAAQVIFGRGASEIAKLHRLNSESMRQAAKDMEELGLRVTKESEANTKSYNAAIRQLGLAFMGIKEAIGREVLPHLTSFAEWFRAKAPDIIKNMRETMRSVIEWAFEAAKGLVEFVHDVVGGLTRLMALYTMVKAGMGIISDAEANKTMGRLSDILDSLKNLRERALAAVDGIKAVITAGGTIGKPTAEDKPTASRNADDLLKIEEKRKAEMLAKDQLIRAEKLKLEEARVGYEADFQNMKTSEDRKFALIMDASRKAYIEELRLLEEKKAIAGSELALRQQVENQIAELKGRYAIQEKQLNQQSLEAMKAKYMEVFSEIHSAFSSQLRGLLAGTTSFTQAFKAMAGDLILAFIGMCTRMALQWAALELARTTATVSGQAARTAAEEAGAIASLALLIPKILKAIAAFAAETFGGIFAFLAPAMGPAAAGPAAAGAATVAAAAGSISAFEVGAWEIGAEQLAVLHPREAVLPAGAAEAFRNFASGGFQGGGGGNTHLHIHTMDAAGVAAFVKKHQGIIGDAAEQWSKKNAFRNPNNPWNK